jgi:hypothetical protein
MRQRLGTLKLACFRFADVKFDRRRSYNTDFAEYGHRVVITMFRERRRTSTSATRPTCPSNFSPMASADPYCSAVPTPNSPPAASSNLFSAAKPAPEDSSVVLTTAAAAAVCPREVHKLDQHVGSADASCGTCLDVYRSCTLTFATLRAGCLGLKAVQMSLS